MKPAGVRNFLSFTLLIALFVGGGFEESSRADSIKGVNLLEGQKSFFRSIPIYDQGNMGTCYAYTTTVIGDFYRLSHGEKIESATDLISPLWIAYSYSAHDDFIKRVRKVKGASGDQPLDAGITGDVFKDVSQHGFLNRGQIDLILRAELPEFYADPNLRSEQIYSLVETLLIEERKMFQNILATKQYPNSTDARVNFPHLYMRAELEPNRAAQGLFSLNDLPADFDTAKSASNSPAPKKIFVLPPINYVPEAYFAQIDHTAIHIFNDPREEEASIEANVLNMLSQRYAAALQFSGQPAKIQAILNLLKKALNHTGGLWGLTQEWFSKHERETHALPSATKNGFDLSNLSRSRFIEFRQVIDLVLTRPNAQPLALAYCSGLFLAGKAVTSKDSNCEGHEGIIVGQRVVSGAVQYLIQNSWGPTCSKRYYGNWECLSGQGAVWIDGEVLFKSSLTLDWLDDPQSTRGYIFSADI